MIKRERIERKMRKKVIRKRKTLERERKKEKEKD